MSPHAAHRSRDYRRRRELLLGVLCEVGFDPVVPEGAYYMMADFAALSDMDDESFARDLIKGVGVATVPGSSFYPRDAQRDTHSAEIALQAYSTCPWWNETSKYG
jgi:aspartate/methionine/tyrosine aminotransferase